MERLFKKRWWDYSDYRYNIGGYVCLPFSALWGVLAAAAIAFLHPLTTPLLLPRLPGRIIQIILQILLGLDTLSVLGVILHVRHSNHPLNSLTSDMQQLSSRLGQRIFERVEQRIERRMLKAHPILTQALPADAPAAPAVFAAGCGFDKLVWLFFISAFLGDITETIYCYATTGILMSRSSVVYGPFSVVWGLGVVVLSLMLHRYQDRNDRYIFLFGTAVGGAYEYICSVFTELVFGTVFWDYSHIPFNLGGRINLLYCFFWGVAAVVWIKIIYPRLSGLIEKIPPRPGRILTWCIVCFMVTNMFLSSAALFRYAERNSGVAAKNAFEQLLDSRFPDTRMERIYPNAIIKK